MVIIKKCSEGNSRICWKMLIELRGKFTQGKILAEILHNLVIFCCKSLQLKLDIQVSYSHLGILMSILIYLIKVLAKCFRVISRSIKSSKSENQQNSKFFKIDWRCDWITLENFHEGLRALAGVNKEFYYLIRSFYSCFASALIYGRNMLVLELDRLTTITPMNIKLGFTGRVSLILVGHFKDQQVLRSQLNLLIEFWDQITVLSNTLI